MRSLIDPRERVGTVGGIMNLSNQIAAISAPIVTGYIVTVTKSYSGAFVAAAVALSIGIAGYVILLGDLEPIARPGQAGDLRGMSGAQRRLSALGSALTSPCRLP